WRRGPARPRHHRDPGRRLCLRSGAGDADGRPAAPYPRPAGQSLDRAYPRRRPRRLYGLPARAGGGGARLVAWGAARFPALCRPYRAQSVRRRNNPALATRTGNIRPAVEGDGAAEGARAVFMTDIMHPCWIYRQAPMDGVSEIAVDVGQLPFNFQIGDALNHI